MTFFDNKAARIINKFNEEKFNLWKFEIETLLASMDLWDIMDGSDEALPCNVDPKV